MASNSSSQPTTMEKAQEYVDKGVSYVQESTFGTGQKEQDSEASKQQQQQQQEPPKQPSNPMLDGKVDQAHPEKIEDYLRSQHTSKPPSALLAESGKKDKGEGDPQAS